MKHLKYGLNTQKRIHMKDHKHLIESNKESITEAILTGISFIFCLGAIWLVILLLSY